jgi:hypothetical protein
MASSMTILLGQHRHHKNHTSLNILPEGPRGLSIVEAHTKKQRLRLRANVPPEDGFMSITPPLPVLPVMYGPTTHQLLLRLPHPPSEPRKTHAEIDIS